MARAYYERLSPESASLLLVESSRTFSHSAATLTFDPGPLARPDGGVDFPAIRAAIESRLHRVPRFREKIRWIPFEQHPIWVDDHDFNLDYHVRHTSLPRPGGMEQLRNLSARIQAQPLDRRRPLWECWVAEGLAGGRFALIFKTHHALVEGSGADLLEVLLSPDPDEDAHDAPAYRPRPIPSAAELVLDEVVRGARLPRQAWERLRTFAAGTDDLPGELLSRVEGVARLLGYSLRRGPETPLDGRVGPHRRFHTLDLSLADARTVRRRLGGSINDVLFTALTGAVATFLRERYMNPATIDFRLATPMRLQQGGSDATGSIGEWIVDLPIWETDPRARHAAVRERTGAAHRASPALGARTLFSLSRWTGSRLLALGAREASRRAPVDLTLTHVPGPEVPMFLRGARLQEAYGHAPLREHGALGIAIFSYDGRLCWGFNADFDLLPDLDRFVAAVEGSFRELVRVARGESRSLALVPAAGGRDGGAA